MARTAQVLRLPMAGPDDVSPIARLIEDGTLDPARIGAILVNINPAYRPRELAYALQRSQVEGLCVIPAFRKSDYVAMLLELLPALRQGQVSHGDFPHYLHHDFRRACAGYRAHKLPGVPECFSLLQDRLCRGDDARFFRAVDYF